MGASASRRRISPRQRRTAYHEAAHAVAAHVLGMPIDRVEMWSLPAREIPTKWGGQCEPDIDWCLEHRPRHETSIWTDDDLFEKLVPGPAERRLAVQRGWRDPGEDHFCTDFIEVVDRLMEEEPPGSEYLSAATSARIDAAHERGYQFVADDANWRAIEAVAAALLEPITRGEFACLKGPQVHALIREVLGETEPSPAEQWAIAQAERPPKSARARIRKLRTGVRQITEARLKARGLSPEDVERKLEEYGLLPR
jgi:hypothetical protein